jgi:RNA-directed DNA polymerase
VVSDDHQSDVATQVRAWWQDVEQESLQCSLEFSHLLHTDVTDCYGALYTHSIAWALHGLAEGKRKKGSRRLLGDKIDEHIRAGRYGQTNGISQGSVLMDFVAELVLGFVDELLNSELRGASDVHILRYRDDYRIFANSDDRAEAVLKLVSDKLRSVGMRLGVAKTFSSRNVVEGSVKPDKLAGIELQELGETNAKTIQKQLLRLHSFGQRFPNSGALRRLVADFHDRIYEQTDPPTDIGVQIAIATDIAYVSPSTFPAVAGILSHLISLAPTNEKRPLWERVRAKMDRVPYNGYLQVWLQRVTRPKVPGIGFGSEEAICRIVDGATPGLWQSSWISDRALTAALDVRTMVVGSVDETSEVIQPEEIRLFKRNARAY